MTAPARGTAALSREGQKERTMRIWEIFLTGLSLSADACAVAMCKGVEMKKFVWKYEIGRAHV